jgi:hypothetical protein
MIAILCISVSLACCYLVPVNILLWERYRDTFLISRHNGGRQSEQNNYRRSFWSVGHIRATHLYSSIDIVRRNYVMDVNVD